MRAANRVSSFSPRVNGICAGGGYELALACDEIFARGRWAFGGQPAGSAAAWCAPAGHGRSDAASWTNATFAGISQTTSARSSRDQGKAGRRLAARRCGVPDEVNFPTPCGSTRRCARGQLRSRGRWCSAVSLEPLEPRDHRFVHHLHGGVGCASSRQANRRVDSRGANRPTTCDAGRDSPGGRPVPGRCGPFASWTTQSCGSVSTNPQSEPSSSAPWAICDRSWRSTARWSSSAVIGLVREIVQMMMRTLKRLELSARAVFAHHRAGIGVWRVAARARARRRPLVMLHDDGEENVIALSPMNSGPLPMSNGLTRLQTRFLGEPHTCRRAPGSRGALQCCRGGRSRSRYLRAR